MEAEDSWEDLKEVPVKDLAQSGSDSERVEAAPAKANVWVSEESDDDMANSREEDAPLPVVAVANPVQVLDDTSSLASEIYKLEDQLATSEMVETLRAEKALLEQRLAEAQRMISDRDQRIKELRVNQLEILQAMSVLKKNHRQFQLGLLKIVETLPPPKAAAELENLISGQIAQQRALESAAETKFMQDDASCLTSSDHPIVKLMRLTRNVNPLEASFMLVRFFCRLENRIDGAVPTTAALVDMALRFWEVTGDFQLYPLYSVMVTHFRSRVLRVGESTDALLFLLTNFCALFYVNRLDFDPSESTDVVVLRNLQAVLLGMAEQQQGPGDDTQLVASIAGPSPNAPAGKLIVKTKRALWIELRKLVVLAYAFVVRNEGERVEKSIRSTLEHIRSTASEELKYNLSERCTPGMQEMIVQFTELLRLMKLASSPQAMVVQLFGQLLSLINGHCCNALMLRRSYSTMHAAAAFRGDLGHLDVWVRANFPAKTVPWLLNRVVQLTEMVNVLFMNKTLLRRPEIRQELCSSLTLAQLCQLLSSYEPQRGEEPVSLSLIQSLMPATSRSHQADVSSVLMDVTGLEPIDLSVLKEDWLLNVPLAELKEHPVPDDIYETFIRFREMQAQAKLSSKVSPTKK